MMPEEDLMQLLPMLILAAGILFNMLLLAFRRNHAVAFISTLAILVTSLISLIFVRPKMLNDSEDLFMVDHFGLYYQTLILLTTCVITVFSFISLSNFFPEKRKEEYYLLILLATLGSGMLVISAHFISFFVSLEILNISLYTLISYYRERAKAIEAGLKYLILAAMASAFLLFGMALVYTIYGSMNFSSLANATTSSGTFSITILIVGIGMMAVGIGFKLGLAPFHIWTPDVYEGASSPISAYISTVSKGAIVAVLLRFFILADLYRFEKIVFVFTVIAILSMLIGNLLAVRQNNLKRMLAYSSIAHFGYFLIALLAGKEMGPQAATFYITAYIITILGAFGLITLVSQSDDEATDIFAYEGLFWKKPILAALFTLLLLSLAGIPLTAGFMGKYFLLSAGIGKGHWLLAITLVVSSVIGVYYYLRVIVVMMKQDGKEVSLSEFPKFSLAGVLILAVLGCLVVWLGISPAWLIELVNRLLTSLSI